MSLFSCTNAPLAYEHGNVSNFIYPQMLAPIIGGLLFDFVGYSFAALFIAAWNSISGIVEYTLLILIYRWDLSNIDVPNYHFN